MLRIRKAQGNCGASAVQRAVLVLAAASVLSIAGAPAALADDGHPAVEEPIAVSSPFPCDILTAHHQFGDCVWATTDEHASDVNTTFFVSCPQAYPYPFITWNNYLPMWRDKNFPLHPLTVTSANVRWPFKHIDGPWASYIGAKPDSGNDPWRGYVSFRPLDDAPSFPTQADFVCSKELAHD